MWDLHHLYLGLIADVGLGYRKGSWVRPEGAKDAIRMLLIEAYLRIICG